MKQILILFVLGLGIVLSSGCSSTRDITVSTLSVEPPKVTIPDVDVLVLRDVSWVVVTSENIQEEFDKLSEQGQRRVLFALGPDGYKNISLNFSDILMLVEQQQAIIQVYKEYYEKTTTDSDKNQK